MQNLHIEIRIAESFEEIDQLMALHKSIWGLEDIEITPSHIYTATIHGGGFALIAYQKNEPIGFIYGFPGVEKIDSPYFYIHNIGVLEKYRSTGVGMLLMLELRNVLVDKNFTLVKWTYDPLETLNASLYIGKLGCITNHYIEEYYGTMNDEINKGLPSDRLITYWYIQSQHVNKKLHTSSTKVISTINKKNCFNSIDSDNQPQDCETLQNQDKYYLELPSNYHQLKNISEDLVFQWRMNIRKHMQYAFSHNLYLTGTIFAQNRFFYVISPSPIKEENPNG